MYSAFCIQLLKTALQTGEKQVKGQHHLIPNLLALSIDSDLTFPCTFYRHVEGAFKGIYPRGKDRDVSDVLLLSSGQSLYLIKTCFISQRLLLQEAASCTCLQPEVNVRENLVERNMYLLHIFPQKFMNNKYVLKSEIFPK